MIAVLVLIFASVALAAAAFVVVPAMATGGGGFKRAGYPAIAGLATVAIGLGVYGFLGQPKLALNSLTGPSKTDYPSLVAMLAERMPNRPGDVQGWTLLGQGYLTLGNPDQAQKALGHAVEAEKAEQGGADPQLLSTYGEAITEASGQVTKEAEDVFKQVLAQDPRNLVARYYTGLALAARGDKAQALQLWEGVLADAPANTPWRGALIDQVAALKASTGGAAPNPEAMVEQLASRLQSSPNDLNGWMMLIRAYSVLGNKDKAVQALTTARGVFANQPDAQDQLGREAAQYQLN